MQVRPNRYMHNSIHGVHSLTGMDLITGMGLKSWILLALTCTLCPGLSLSTPLWITRSSFHKKLSSPLSVDITIVHMHTQLTMYYIRPFQYDCTSRWLYVLVLVALLSVLITSREYTCIFTFYTLPWHWTVCKFQKRNKWGKAFYSFHPHGTICFVTADGKLV